MNSTYVSKQTGTILLLVLFVIALFAIFTAFTLTEATRQQQSANLTKIGVQLRLACQSATQVIIRHIALVSPVLWQSYSGSWYVCKGVRVDRNSCASVFTQHDITTHIEVQYLTSSPLPTMQITTHAHQGSLGCSQQTQVQSIATDQSDDLAQSLRITRSVWVEP